MYIVDSDEATSWPARWAYIPSFKLNTGHFSCQSPSPKVIFGYSKYPSANQLNVERTIHQLAAKKKSHAQHFGGISQRHVAGCLMLLDVTIPIISLIISHTHSNLTSLYQPFHFYGSTFRDQPPWRLSPPQYLSSRWSVPKPSAGDLSGGGVYSPNRPKK